MNITYTFGNAITAQRKPITVAKVKHGVTEVSLSDGRIMRLTLHIDSVKPGEGDNLDINYQVISEVMREPDLPILDIHEAIQ